MFSEMDISVYQNPGVVKFDNFEQVKQALMAKIDVYTKTNYESETLEIITRDRDELKAVKKQINDVKKELEKAYNAPLEDVKRKLEELISIVKEPLDKLDNMVKESQKKETREEIMSYANQKASILGRYKDKILESDSFFNPRWLNISYKKKDWKKDIDEIIQNAATDINSIVETGGDKQNLMLARYYETLSMDGMADFIRNSSEETKDGVESVEDKVIGYKVLKVFGNEHQMAQLMMELELMDMDYEEIDNGMPQDMEELTVPDFDSFVAFDIEHTGSFGAAKGDAESEIVEIGAVKFVNGVIVDKFDELCNPGRKMVPKIARLTHITDDMLKDKPSVDAVIKQFRDFVGDSILIGHNINGCDIPHIQRAAKRAGFKFDNKYLDTKKLALRIKNKYKLENIKLTTISDFYGIDQKDAHRAWCDAEANAYVYLKLKNEC